MKKISVRLLLSAGVLLLIAGLLFGVTQSWVYAGLLWSGAFGSFVAAMNFGNSEDDGDER